MPCIAALLAGLMFGLGLIISGMINPAKVLAFLDLAGQWDPSLAFVMGGALLVAALGAALARGRTRSVLGEPMRLPARSPVDRRLVLGSLCFGAGWGLAGLCPGPAIAALAYGGSKAWIFMAAMLAGMAVFEVAERVRAKAA